jgi:hypothetical protein
MKLYAVILGLAVAGSVSIASAGDYQQAVQETLESASLKAVTANYASLELADIKVEKLASAKAGRDEYVLTLFYRSVGTAGGCYVNTKVTHSQMEMIMPNGIGYQIQHRWSVDAKAGICRQ